MKNVKTVTLYFCKTDHRKDKFVIKKNLHALINMRKNVI